MATRPIDEKIVVMKLDNSDFKQKATETTGIFGKIRDGLSKIPSVNLGKTSKELGEISKETKGIQMDKLADGVQVVADRFTNLGLVGVTALQNITNRAVDAGLALAKSLTFDQVTAGFQEYELKMRSIQTILANTDKHGTTLDDVTKSLETLNDYADKTIYNFGDMTRNIGLFTNAGLKLEESTSMIKGFSNAAAASGTDATGAAHAAYQLSQALSAGTIRLMDWRSLTNVGMGNKNMQEGLVELATAMNAFNGTGIDGATVLQDFNGSLEKNWLSADVMSKYLQIMARDMSATEMAALGLNESQIAMFEKQAQIAEDAATKVRTFSALMDGLKEAIGSGWATTFELIFGNFDQATELWTKLNDSIGGWFTETGNARNEILKGIRDGGGMDNIFVGVENAAKPIVQLFQAIGDGFERAFPTPSVDRLIAMTRTFKELTSGLSLSQERISQLTTISHGLFSIFSTVWEIAKRLTLSFVQLIPEGTTGGVLDFVEKLAKMAISFNESVKEGNGLTRFIDGLGNVLNTVGNIISTVINHVINFSGSMREHLGTAIDWIVDKLTPLGEFLKETFSGMGGEDLLGAGGLVGIILVVKKVMDLLSGDDLFGGIGDLVDGVKDVLDNAGEALNSFATGVKYANLTLIAVAVGILAVSLKTLEGIKTEDLVKGITSLGIALGVMIVGMMAIDKFDLSGGLRASITLIALASAVTIMAVALKSISILNPNELATGIGGLVAVTAALALAIVTMSTFGSKIQTSSLQLVALATAVLILANAVNTMASINTGELFAAIGALALIFAQLTIFLKIVDGTKFGVSSALGLLAVAGAVQMMVTAIQSIVNIDSVMLVQGLITIAAILAQIAIFSALTSGPTLLAAGAGMLLIAGAINALVGPITTLGSLSWEELTKGLGAMALALVAVAAAATMMQGGLVGAAGLLAMAVALNTLIGPIQTFANMTWGELIKGFVGLAGGMAVLAGAAMLLTPAVGPMLAFSAAMLGIGVAALAVGAGIALFGAGLVTLATLTATSVAAIISALALLIKGLGDLIIYVVDFVVKLGLALIDGITKLVPPLADAVVMLIVRLLQTIERYLPDFIDSGIMIIGQLIVGIGESIPVLVDAGVKAIVALIQGLADAIENNAQLLISAVLDLLGEIILLFVEAGVQVIVALLGWIPGVKSAAEGIGKAAADYIRDNFGAKEIAEEKGTQFVTSLNSKQSEVRTAGVNLATAGKDGMSSVDVHLAGEQFASRFASGIMSKKPNVEAASNSIATAASSRISSVLQMQSPSKVTTKLGEHTGQGFANGISKKKEAANKSAKSVADAAKEGFKEKMDAAEYKLKIGEIDSEGYIASLKKIRDEYSKYPKLVQEANLKIKKAETDSVKNREEAEKKKFDASKKWIDDRKFYNELSLKEELEAWERLQAKYEEGTEQRKEADKQVYTLRKSLNEKLLEINNDYVDKIKDINQELIDEEQRLNDEYANSFDERRKSLIGFAGLFEEISKESEVTGAQLVANLSDQVSAFKNWQAEITKLASKAIDDGLLEELKQMGPKALHEIRALNALSETELQRYSDLYAEKSKLATEQAEKELAPMKANTEKAIEELRKTAGDKLQQVQNEWTSKIQGITNATSMELRGLGPIGSDAVQGLINGMQSRQGELEAVAREIGRVVDEAVRKQLQIKSPSRVMAKIGGYVMDGIMVGIEGKTPEVVNSITAAAKTISYAFESGFHIAITGELTSSLDANTLDFIRDYNDIIISSQIGSETRRLEIVKEFADKRKKIEDDFNDTHSKAMEDRRKVIKEALEMNSTYFNEDQLNKAIESRLNLEYGWIIQQKNNEIAAIYAEEAAALRNLSSVRAKTFEKQKSFMEKARQLYAISLEDQYEMYDEFSNMYAKDSDEFKYFNDLKLLIVKEMFDGEKRLIDRRKKYNKLSLKDELDAYEDYINKYVEGSEERLYYEDKIAETKKAIHYELLSLNEEYVEKVRDLNDELIRAENEAAETIASAYDEIYNKMDEDLITAKEDYLSKVEELNQKLIDDEQRLNDEYENAVKERTDSLYSFAGLFDKVERKSGVSGKRLMRNLQGQVDAFKKWSDNMDSLSRKGLDKGLLDELRAMGPDAATEIAALNKLSTYELAQYNNIWKEKTSLASQQAIYELEWLNKETGDAIQELNEETARQLSRYEKEWMDTHDDIIWFAHEAYDEIERDVYDSLDSIYNSTYDQLDAYEQEWLNSINKIKDNTTGVFNAMEEEMPAIGENVIDGLIKGLEGNTEDLLGAASYIGNSLADAIRTVLDIHSPSRVTELLGKQTGQGLVIGILSKTKDIINASKDFANSAKDSLNKFLDGFELPRDAEELHFKAVVDYEAFDIGRFGKMDTFSLEPDLSYARQSIAVARDYMVSKASQFIQPQVKKDTKQVTPESNPINVHTTIELDGEVVARKTFKHTDNMLGSSISNNMRYSGVR